MPWVKGKSGNPTGARPETIEVKEVRRLAQSRSLEAFKTIDAMMTGAERESVRLAAAIAILKLAGVSMDAASVAVNVTPRANPYTQTPTEKLLAMATVSSTAEN